MARDARSWCVGYVGHANQIANMANTMRQRSARIYAWIMGLAAM
jgi:hypothetical protein